MVNVIYRYSVFLALWGFVYYNVVPRVFGVAAVKRYFSDLFQRRTVCSDSTSRVRYTLKYYDVALRALVPQS